LDVVIRSGSAAKVAMEPPVVLISGLYHSYHLGLVPLSSYLWSYFGNWVEFETKTTFPRMSATLEIVPLHPAIDYWFVRVVNLLLHLTIGLFEKIVVCGFPSHLCEVSRCSPPLIWAMGMLWWAFNITHVVAKVPEHVSCLHGYQTPPHLSLKLLNGFILFLLIFLTWYFYISMRSCFQLQLHS